jgi:hypothetical protein
MNEETSRIVDRPEVKHYFISSVSKMIRTYSKCDVEDQKVLLVDETMSFRVLEEEGKDSAENNAE